MQVGPKEIEEGNIEYKRCLFNLTESKIHHLAAQMNWRINEGNGICYYYLGICDDGYIYTDFTQERMDYTLDMIKIMVNICNSYIDNIIINRYNEYIWLNIIIKRKNEYLREYRILILSDTIRDLIHNIFTYSGIDYIKSNKSIYYNTYINNNDKYLFFEVSKRKTNKLLKLVDFNLIINDNIQFDDISLLWEYIENNISNKDYIEYNSIIKPKINIINKMNIPSIGTILFCFLKQGTIKVGINIIVNNIKYNILSIHNNMIDCYEAIGPATISIKVITVL